MDLGPSEIQTALKTNARSFLERVCPPAHVREMEEDRRGFDIGVWRQMCDQGWVGLLIPEEYGGQGGDISDMVVLHEEIGRALLPSPLFASGVLAALTVCELGTAAQRQALLPGIAAGNTIATVAVNEQSGTFDGWGVQATAIRDGDGWRLDGVKLYVPYAQVADVIIVAARVAAGDDGIAFFLVDPKSDGARVTILDTIGKDHQYAVTLPNVVVGADALLGPERGGWSAFARVFDACAVVIAGWSIGGAERSLELAIEYSKQRVQFGRPIGAFQALQHKMARMATELTGAQLVVYEAAYKLANHEPAALDVSLAKAAATMAYTTCSIEGCHIFGGAGFVRGSDMELFYRKALGAEVAFGTPRWHKRRITALLARDAAATPVHAH